MNIKELEVLVNEKAETITSGYKYDIKEKLCSLINNILEEKGVKDVKATAVYGEPDNAVYIVKAGNRYDNSFWPIHIAYKTTRKLSDKRNRWTNRYDATFTLKSIEIWKRDDVKTFEDFVRIENKERDESIKETNYELDKLKSFIENNPEFPEMYKLYQKHKNALPSEVRDLFW